MAALPADGTTPEHVRQIAEAVAGSDLSPYVILVLIYAIFLVLGCFFDPMSVMVLTIPVLYPVLLGLGFDLIWFGIILLSFWLQRLLRKNAI